MKQILIKKETNTEKAGKTARKILVAARAAFAENGYSGTHMNEIALLAGVNKATLYANVIHQVVGNIAQHIAEAVAQAKGPEEKIHAYINTIVEAVDKNPEIPPIMMREVASGGATMPRVVLEDIASIVAILAGVLEEGRKKRVFMETSPFLIHMMVMGTILFYKKGSLIKDRQSWIPEALKVYDKKLKGGLGEEVATLVLKAIKR